MIQSNGENMKRHLILYVCVIGIMTSVYGCGHDNPISPSLVETIGPVTKTSANSFSEAMITFSFDDGRECTFNSAIPILDTAGFKSTNYIITKRLTGTEDYITGAKVLSLETRGHEIGNHTRTHPDLTLLSPTELQNEIEGAKQDLLVLGVKKVETLAYPFGAYNIGIAEFISSAGYLGARTTDEGGTLPSTNRFALKRRNLGGAVTISDVQSWVNVAVANREWLIMTSHHVDYSPNDYSITPDLFRQIVDLVVSKRLRVVTISEGLKVM